MCELEEPARTQGQAAIERLKVGRRGVAMTAFDIMPHAMQRSGCINAVMHAHVMCLAARRFAMGCMPWLT